MQKISQCNAMRVIHKGSPHKRAENLVPSPLTRATVSVPRSPSSIRTIVEWIPAQGTCRLVTTCKPLEQTARMEKIFASLTAFIWHLLVGRNNRVADGTFGVAFQCSNNVLSEDAKAIGD
jgi:hypothetical protein